MDTPEEEKPIKKTRIKKVKEVKINEVKPKIPKLRKKFKFVPLSRDELLQRTTFTIDWN